MNGGHPINNKNNDNKGGCVDGENARLREMEMKEKQKQLIIAIVHNEIMMRKNLFTIRNHLLRSFPQQ